MEQLCHMHINHMYFQVIATITVELQNQILHQQGVKKQIPLKHVLIKWEKFDVLAPYPHH